ncbi:NAD(P)-dependent oxidoreductase [Bradyrhizobium sp. HKCCYLS1011]|uniref:NAD(P)-dependent oxidoreductase n=1 Tax=Bradyrhizobium sp. HKCCYLS1011 TaxID=3420733 RepID=UPI003EBC8223
MLDEESFKGDTGNRPSLDKIGVIGLGLMGTEIAANLAAVGHCVRAYVRRPARLVELKALNLIPTTSMQDLSDCNILLSMLPDDDAVREVFFGKTATEGIAAHLGPGTIHLSMSTISTTASAEFAHAHKIRGQDYVAAPVFGNPAAAKARELAVIVAGPVTACKRCSPLIERLGRTFFVGSEPAQANLIKLLGNMMTATTLQVLGELIALLRKRGQDPQQFLDIMTGTMFGSRVHTIYGRRIVAGDYAPGLAMPMALKDVRLALAEAEKASVAIPSVSVVRDRMITAIARGHAARDWTALALLAFEEAGL